MAATATARSAAPARRAPARRAPAPKPRRRPAPQPRRRRAQTPVGGFVPVAVGAVGGLADSGLVVRLTRSRLWIGLLATMLVGIVALNVMALSFSSSSSQAARQADELRQANSALRGDIATMQSNDKIAAAAAELGLATPGPGDFRYLRPSADDAATAAKRLRAGEFSDYVAPAATTVAAEPPVTETAPVVTETAAVVTEPVAETTAAETAPVTDTAEAPVSPTGGGVTP